MLKKTLVLSSVDGGNEKAVMSFEKNNGDTEGQVRLYNFHDEPNGILTVGLKEGDRVVKIGLTRVGNYKYTFATSTPLDLGEFSCAIVNIYKGEAKALLHGCTQNTKLTDELLASAVADMQDVTTFEECKNVLDKNNIHLEDEHEIEKDIDDTINTCGDKCTTCKYRYAFFSDDETPQTKSESFYNSISEDITNLFATHGEEQFLSQIIPFSKWVKIENEDSNDYYVLGLIYENDQVKYICYGVPGLYTDAPPKELQGYAEWLPLDSTKENEYGYWITYQDADTGENVKATFTVV